jgi:penicillin amidase
MQADQYMVMAETWMPRIMAALSTQEFSGLPSQAYESLKNWNYLADANQTAPALFHVVLQETLERTFKERLGDSLYLYWLSNSFIVHNAINSLVARGESEWFDNPSTAQVENLDSVLIAAFGGAVDYLTQTFGDKFDDWTWGRLHTLTLFHPVGRQIPILGRYMNVGPFEMGGGSGTVDAGLYRLTQPYAMLAGASQRHIFDLGNMKNSLRIIPAGISGNFMSRHYDDQVDLWRQVEYRPFHLDRDDVEAEAAYRMKIIPASQATAER